MALELWVAAPCDRSTVPYQGSAVAQPLGRNCSSFCSQIFLNLLFSTSFLTITTISHCFSQSSLILQHLCPIQLAHSLQMFYSGKRLLSTQSRTSVPDLSLLPRKQQTYHPANLTANITLLVTLSDLVISTMAHYLLLLSLVGIY